MLAPEWGLQALIDITDEQARNDLARVGDGAVVRGPVRARRAARRCRSSRWTRPRRSPSASDPLAREADLKHVKAIDAYWISAAEHGMNASTFTARVVASTGADVAAALSAVGRCRGRCTAERLARADDARRGGRRRRRGSLGQARWIRATG